MTADKTPGEGPKKKTSRSASARKSSPKAGGRKPAAKKTPRKTAGKTAAKKPETAKVPEPVEETAVPAAEPEASAAADAGQVKQKEPMEEETEDSPVAEETVAVDLLQAPELDHEERRQPDHLSEMADKIIAFHLGGQRYAVPIGVVQEIQQIVEFSEIPAAGGAVIGMVNLRGSVIPAIDMRFLIGLEPQEYALDTPMVICHAHGELVALVVDHVEDVMTMPEGCLDPPPAMHNLSSKMIGVCRMGSDLIYLLAVEDLVAPVELPRGR